MAIPDKIDSNIVGASYSVETSLKVLAGSPIWQAIDVNSYSDFGAEVSNVARAPINPSRQNRKGTTTDVEPAGGFNIDMTMNTMTPLLQGFFFADAREKDTNLPLNAAAIAISDITVGTVVAASGMDSYDTDDIVLMSGNTIAGNNGITLVTSSTATILTVVKVLTANASPAATSKVTKVGHQFAAGVASITASASSITLDATGIEGFGLIPGEWIFIGGDDAGTFFDNNVQGYARILAVNTDSLSLDQTTFTAATDAGAGKTIQIFFGTMIKNELPPLIIRRSYNWERSLGNDGDGVQTQYLEGSVANELTLNVPSTDKMNIDMSYVAVDETTRSGAVGPKSGTRVADPGEEGLNTSQNVFRSRIAVIDPLNLNSDALFGFVSAVNIVVSNNVSGLKAVGVVGSFELNVGTFDITGTVTAYFQSVAAIESIRANADVEYSLITAHDNEAFVWDIPLVGTAGGRLSVTKDEAVTVPLEATGVRNQHDYTLAFIKLPYVPTAGMVAA